MYFYVLKSLLFLEKKNKQFVWNYIDVFPVESKFFNENHRINHSVLNFLEKN